MLRHGTHALDNGLRYVPPDISFGGPKLNKYLVSFREKEFCYHRSLIESAALEVGTPVLFIQKWHGSRKLQTISFYFPSDDNINIILLSILIFIFKNRRNFLHRWMQPDQVLCPSLRNTPTTTRSSYEREKISSRLLKSICRARNVRHGHCSLSIHPYSMGLYRLCSVFVRVSLILFVQNDHRGCRYAQLSPPTFHIHAKGWWWERTHFPPRTTQNPYHVYHDFSSFGSSLYTPVMIARRLGIETILETIWISDQ